MEVELIENIERLFEIEKEWNDLMAASAQGDIFVLPQWLFSWWETYGDNKNLYTVALWENRILCGLFLLYKIKKGPFKLITFAGYPDGSDRMDFILMRNMENECLAVFVEWIYKQTDWDIVSLREFGPFSRNPEVLSDILVRHGKKCHVSKDLPGYYLPLTDHKAFDTYFNKTVSKNGKEQLRKSRAGLNRLKSAEWKLLDGINDKIIEEMKELDTAKSFRGLKGMSFFSDPKKEQFLKGLLKGKINRENISLFCLRIDGKLAAYMLNLKYMDRLLYYQASFDMAYSRLSPGVNMMYRVIEYAFRGGYKEFDFLRGDEPYKKKYSKVFRQNRRVQFYNINCKASILIMYHEKIKPLRTKLKKNRLLTALFPARLRRKWDI